MDELTKTNKQDLYIKVYISSFDSEALTLEEQSVYLAIKSYMPVGQEEGTAFPGIESISRRAKIGVRKTKYCIKSLIDKGFLSKKRRGQGKTNIYTLHDSPDIWRVETAEERRNIEENKASQLSTAELLAELMRRGIEIPTTEAQEEPTEEQGEEIPIDKAEEPTEGAEEPETVQELDAEEIREHLQEQHGGDFIDATTGEKVEFNADYVKKLCKDIRRNVPGARTQQVKKAIDRASQFKIKSSLAGYIIKLLKENDIDQNKNIITSDKKPKNSFTGFKQREVDFTGEESEFLTMHIKRRKTGEAREDHTEKKE